MTDLLKRISDAEAVAAALHVYADAIRLGQTPMPNHITLHAAALPRETFLALADRLDARIEIVEPTDDYPNWLTYARIDMPFGAGILPAGVDATAHATCSVNDALRREIATHNAQCVEGAHDV